MSEGRNAATQVAVRDARGFWRRKEDCGSGGYDFPCRMVRWEGSDADPLPWPIEDVKPIAEHPDALSREEYEAMMADE